MDKGGQSLGATGSTLSASRFAELTGVSRERLRTWERRYGFPTPQRVGGGPRRYALADAPAVVAVRRASEEGVPLPAAIADAQAGPSETTFSRSALAQVAEQLPAPLIVVSGPAPTRIEYVNPALVAVSEAPRVGTEIARAATWFAGSDCERGLQSLFTTSTQTLECVHPAWSGQGELVRSLLFRLPPERGRPSLVALVQLERPRERETRRALAEAQAERDRLDVRLDRHERWLGAIAALAELFQRESGAALLQATADTLVRRLTPLDAGIALYMGGELALGSSSRGTLGPRMVTVAAHADLGAVLRDRTPAWLTPASAAAFGAPSDLHLLAVPVTVVAETLGALLLVTDQRNALDDEIAQLLSVLSASIGFAVLRDRLVDNARQRLTDDMSA